MAKTAESKLLIYQKWTKGTVFKVQNEQKGHSLKCKVENIQRKV